MSFTKRNHYNPCFWTALWNPDYYEFVTTGTAQTSPVRTQRIYALSVKSSAIFQTTVENIHYDKNLGIAEISREAAEDFARRYHPDRYQTFVRDSATSTYPVFIDFEQILSFLEKMPPYQVLLDVAKRGSLQSAEEKAFIGCFIVLQQLRSHSIMNSMIEWHRELQRKKFEVFVTLKWLLGDADSLFRLVYPIVACQWTLFRTSTDSFPLCDSPVLSKPHSIMVALSPRLLLEIQPSFPAPADEWRERRSIKPGKLAEFRRRTIGSTFREIIFGESQVLEYWQGTREFSERVALMKDVRGYNRLVQEQSTGELWKLNAYGNQG